MKIFYSAVLICLFWCSYVRAAEFTYVNYSVADSYLNGKEQFSINTDNGKMLGKDTIDDLQICPNSSPFICFYNQAIDFSVPRTHINAGQAWEHAEFRFSVKRLENLELLGARVPVFVIHSQRPNNKEYFFYYSEEDGLLAIKYYDGDKDKAQFFTSTSLCGFGFKQEETKGSK